ncbi:MAG: NERD domain-containing protein [Lentisphaeraceae bacterium]|nr:NERD domain-containing protein [Lentisphaeraceae bacterium]
MSKLRKWFLYDKGKRSPIEDIPLNFAGQTLRNEIDDYALTLTGKSFMLLAITIVTLQQYIKMSWGRTVDIWAFNFLIIGIIPALICLFIILSANKNIKHMRKLHLGWKCETLVGQELDRYRHFGYSVFHDIPLEKGERIFNIDHLLIGPAGIVVVETKGKSKPLKGETKIVYQGKTLQFSDGTYSKAPIRQIEALQHSIKKLMEELLKKEGSPVQHIPVTGIIVYPGWFIDFTKNQPSDFIICNEQHLLKNIKRLNKNMESEAYMPMAKAMRHHLKELRQKATQG